MTDTLIKELDRNGLREFGLVTGLLVAVLFGLFFPWLFAATYPVWPWLIFAILGTWAIVAPESLRPVYFRWMQFALLLSRVTTPIILGIVYFLIVTPMGLIMRMFGKDPMKRKRDERMQSYRVPPTTAGKSKLEDPY